MAVGSSYFGISVDHTTDAGMTIQKLESFLDDMIYQPSWRREADLEADYYDNNQLTAEELAIIEEKGLAPLVFNLISPTVDAVLGMEAKMRMDWIVKPEHDKDEDFATALNVKLKDAEKSSRADRACSDAYAHQIKVGMGWVEVSRESDPFKPKYRVQSIHRREIWWDWRSRNPDLSDSRYLVRRKWYDKDVVQHVFPKYRELIDHVVAGWNEAYWDQTRFEEDPLLLRGFNDQRTFSIEDYEWHDSYRGRVLLYEIWYRIWVTGLVIKFPNGRVIEFDKKNPRHVEAVAANAVKIEKSVFNKIRLSYWIGPHRVADVPNPNPFNYFPYIPFWGKREDRTGIPYGLIRAMKSPQDEVNARRQKMMWLMSAKRVLADDDAVLDHYEARDEISRPDAYIKLNKDRKNANGFKVESDFNLSQQQFMVMKDAESAIQSTGGVFNSVMGKKDAGADSGVAISNLVEQASTTLAEINDNTVYARQAVGDALLALIAEDLTQDNISVDIKRSMTGGRKTVILNQVVDGDLNYKVRNNDVTRIKTMVELEDIPSSPTYRAQSSAQLINLTSSLPDDLKAAVLDIVIESTDIPDKQKIIKRIQAVTGVGVSPEDMTEEEKAALQANQQKQQQAEQLNQEMLMARFKELTRKTEKIEAEISNIRAKTDNTEADTQETEQGLDHKEENQQIEILSKV